MFHNISTIADNENVLKDELQQTSSQSSIRPLPDLPMDEVIQGSSFSYTRAEAKMYANEEPCDTWRHFDVHPPDS